MIKRIVDIALAVFGLLAAAPLFAIIAVGIKLDSPGPVFFSQRRLGKNGVPFRLHKFRKFPSTWGNTGPGVTVAGDVRMTALGRFLERSKLDELPQLWNILRGEMSFVGPRPESLRYADLFQEEFAQILEYLPGIFGPNQIGFRNESEMYPPDQDPEEFYRAQLFPKKARADIAYFRDASIFHDLVWILRGLFVSIAGAVNWRRTLRLHGATFALDLFIIELAWLLANLVRFDGLPQGSNIQVFISGIWLLPAVLLPVMILVGVYRHLTKHFAVKDALHLASANAAGWGLAYLVMVGLLHRHASFFLGLFGFLLCLSLMVSLRLWHRERWRLTNRSNVGDTEIRIGIYGAGHRGSALASFLENGFGNVKIVGFLDDNDLLFRGRTILGHKILGSERDLNTVHAVHSLDQLWTTYEPNAHKQRRLDGWCEENDVQLIIVPAADPFSRLRGPVVSKHPTRKPDRHPKATRTSGADNS